MVAGVDKKYHEVDIMTATVNLLQGGRRGMDIWGQGHRSTTAYGEDNMLGSFFY